MQKSQSLCAAYAADDNYGKYLGISMLSLFESNKDFEEITVFVLDCGMKEPNKERLKSIAERYKRKVYFMSMEKAVSALDLRMGARKISIASYARLFLASVIPGDYDKLLYLDCDTIVRGSLRDLWNMEMGNYLIAGVRDTVDLFFLKKIGLEPEEYYVNAGILLVHLKAWREEQLESQFMDFIRKFEGNVPHHDQGTINGVCVKRKGILPLKYNVTSNIYSFSAKTIKRIYFLKEFYFEKELESARKNPVILHFTTGLVGRPWEKGCTHPMKKEYLKAARYSPWKNEPLLPDSRKFSVKVFAAFYNHMPLVLSEQLYRILWRLSHIRD